MKICLQCDKDYDDILIECPVCESDLRYRANENFIEAPPRETPAITAGDLPAYEKPLEKEAAPQKDFTKRKKGGKK